MKFGDRVKLLKYRGLVGTIVHLNIDGNILVEYEDHPGFAILVEPHDIDLVEKPEYFFP